MRLLVDEDLGSREILRRLEEALPGTVLAPQREMSDEAVWTRAQGHGAAILTANVVDFLSLAAERPDHHKLLLVYRVNDPTKDLQAADIAARVAAILARDPAGLRSMILGVNNFPLE